MVLRLMSMIPIRMQPPLTTLQCRLSEGEGDDDKKYFILLGSFAPFSLQRLGGDLTCFSAFHSSCVDTRPRWIERSIGGGARKQCFGGPLHKAARPQKRCWRFALVMDEEDGAGSDSAPLNHDTLHRRQRHNERGRRLLLSLLLDYYNTLTFLRVVAYVDDSVRKYSSSTLPPSVPHRGQPVSHRTCYAV